MKQTRARIRSAVKSMTPGRDFTCWSGPTGAGTVRISPEDLKGMCDANEALLDALRKIYTRLGDATQIEIGPVADARWIARDVVNTYEGDVL